MNYIISKGIFYWYLTNAA